MVFADMSNIDTITICGLDCSSTVCGYNILEVNKVNKTYSLLSYGYKTFNKDFEPIDKVLQFKNEFLPLFENVDMYVLEDSMKTYTKTHPTTIAKLTHINASIEVLLTIMYGKDRMEKINVNTARKLALGKSRVNNMKGKDYAFSAIMELFSNQIQLEYTPKSKKIKEEMFDITDSIVLSLAYAKKNKFI
jgi:hypothetical protein